MSKKIQCDICGKDIDHGGYNLSVKTIHKDGKFQIRQKTKGIIDICEDCMFELFYAEIPIFVDKRPDSNLINIESVIPMKKLLKFKGGKTMYNRNDSKKKIAKKKATNKAYNTKKNYITKTLGKDYCSNGYNSKNHNNK